MFFNFAKIMIFGLFFRIYDTLCSAPCALSQSLRLSVSQSLRPSVSSSPNPSRTQRGISPFGTLEMTGLHSPLSALRSMPCALRPLSVPPSLSPSLSLPPHNQLNHAVFMQVLLRSLHDLMGRD